MSELKFSAADGDVGVIGMPGSGDNAARAAADGGDTDAPMVIKYNASVMVKESHGDGKHEHLRIIQQGPYYNQIAIIAGANCTFEPY